MNLLSKEIMVVAGGGALGSVARFLLSRSVQLLMPYESLPWGIITVNVLGCFCFGIIYGLFSHDFIVSPVWRTGLLIGVLGGFTTFSSFSIDTFQLLEKGAIALALSNIFISVFVCLSATAFGVWLIRALMG